MFLNSGDILVSSYTLKDILTTIKNYTMPYVYSYHWIDEKEVEMSNDKGYKAHIFKTEFL